MVNYAGMARRGRKCKRAANGLRDEPIEQPPSCHETRQQPPLGTSHENVIEQVQGEAARAPQSPIQNSTLGIMHESGDQVTQQADGGSQSHEQCQNSPIQQSPLGTRHVPTEENPNQDSQGQHSNDTTFMSCNSDDAGITNCLNQFQKCIFYVHNLHLFLILYRKRNYK